MGSSIPAVRVELRDRLRARSGLAGVGVFTGDLFEDTPPEAIVLHTVREWRQAPVGMPARNTGRDETYTLVATIWIVRAGAGEDVVREAEDRAFALAAEIEAELLDDPTLGDLVWSALFAGGDEVANRMHPTGRVTQLDALIEVQARV